jgi:SAM-dependent methyltransferase
VDCRICGGKTEPAGAATSPLTGTAMALARCPSCGYAFVCEPRTDYGALYDEAYYAGRGADPHVDYITEMSRPDTVRTYEWRGLTRILGALGELAPASRWLDYGCGLGGLVRYVNAHGLASAVGFDEGYGADRMAATGIPYLDSAQLLEQRGTFDVVTAVEVVEHFVDPAPLFADAFDALRSGGVLFLTTGNAAPHRERLGSWEYASVPDVHVSFFEPRTLAHALERAGFEVLWPGFVDGFDDVIRYKVLKALKIKRRNLVERAVPWRWTSRVVDRRHLVTAMPAGRKP